MFSRQFTKREKVLLVILAVLGLFAAYLFAVQQPVSQSMESLSARQTEAEMRLMVLETRHARLRKMEKELDELFADGEPAEIPSYDNLRHVMDFLGEILKGATDYSVVTTSLETGDGGIVRRNITLSFTAESFDEAYGVLKELAACPYRNAMNDLQIVPVADLHADELPALNESAVRVTTNVVFVEALDG